EVGELGARRVSEQEPGPDGSGRVGGALPQGGGAAGGQDDRARRYDGAVVERDADGPSARGEDAGPAPALQDVDPLVLGGQRRELADDPAAGGGPAGVDDPARRVAALQPQRQAAGAVG